MEISVQSQELIESLSKRIGELTIELETTRLALTKAQDGIMMLEEQLTAMSTAQRAAMEASSFMTSEEHPVL